MNALGLEFGSAAQLSKRPGSVWNCLWGNALKRSGIISKSRVSYPDPGFLSSATWPSLLKKHYNGLNQTILHSFGNHPADSRDCLVWKREKEINTLKYTNNISFPEACKIIQSNPINLSHPPSRKKYGT